MQEDSSANKSACHAIPGTQWWKGRSGPTVAILSLQWVLWVTVYTVQCIHSVHCTAVSTVYSLTQLHTHTQRNNNKKQEFKEVWSMVAHACDPSTGEIEARDSQGQSGKFMEIFLHFCFGYLSHQLLNQRVAPQPLPTVHLKINF